MRVPLTLVAAVGAAAVTGYVAAARSPLMASGAIIGTAGALWVLRSAGAATFGVLAVIAVLPFGVLPLRLGVAPTMLDAALAAVFLVWAGRAATGKCSLRLTSVGVALVAYAGVLLGGYVLSNEALHPDETARQFAKIVIAHLAFLPLVNLLDTRKGVTRFVTWLAFLAAGEALIGLALYLAPRTLAHRALAALGPLGYPTGGSVLRYLPDTDRLRATGTSVDPNMLGALLMLAAAMLVPQLLAPRPFLSRRTTMLLLAPLAACLLVTFSRGSWLGLAGGVTLIGALRYRRLWVILAVLLALAMTLPQAQGYVSHLGAGLRAEDRASAMRIGELQNAGQIIQRYPWFGVGWGDGGQSIELEFTLGVSNIFLTVAERAGLPALAVYLWALIAAARLLWPAARARLTIPDDDGLLLGIVAALVGAMIAGLVDHHFAKFPHLIALLWAIVAAGVVAARTAPDVVAAETAPRPEFAPRNAPVRLRESSPLNA